MAAFALNGMQTTASAPIHFSHLVMPTCDSWGSFASLGLQIPSKMSCVMCMYVVHLWWELSPTFIISYSLCAAGYLSLLGRSILNL